MHQKAIFQSRVHAISWCFHGCEHHCWPPHYRWKWHNVLLLQCSYILSAQNIKAGGFNVIMHDGTSALTIATSNWAKDKIFCKLKSEQGQSGYQVLAITRKQINVCIKSIAVSSFCTFPKYMWTSFTFPPIFKTQITDHVNHWSCQGFKAKPHEALTSLHLTICRKPCCRVGVRAACNKPHNDCHPFGTWLDINAKWFKTTSLYSYSAQIHEMVFCMMMDSCSKCEDQLLLLTVTAVSLKFV